MALCSYDSPSSVLTPFGSHSYVCKISVRFNICKEVLQIQKKKRLTLNRQMDQCMNRKLLGEEIEITKNILKDTILS